MFNVNLNNLVRQYIHRNRRKPKILAEVDAFLSPLNNLYNRFQALVSEANFYLSYNGQQVSVEWLLNDVWPAAGGGIYIETVNSTIQPTFLSNVEDQQPPLYVSNIEDQQPALYLLNLEDYNTQYDFIVWVPAALVFDQAKMMNLINRYRLAGMRYTTQTY